MGGWTGPLFPKEEGRYSKIFEIVGKKICTILSKIGCKYVYVAICS
jgi:hypothetical protein